MERFVIYGLADPRNGQLRYVGKSTTGASQRLASHLCPSSLRDQTKKNGWLKGLLKKGLKPEVFVIEVCPDKDTLNEAERHQIASLRAIGCDLANMTPGGDGKGRPCPPELRARLSSLLKGRRLAVRTPESYAAQGLRSRGRKRSPEAVAKTAAARRGTRHSPEAIAKMSAAHLQRNAEPGHAEKLSRAHGGRPFVDQHGRRYETQASAARLLGMTAGQINRVLLGKRRHAKSLVFTFLEE